MYCIHCGERVIESAKFCAACGEKIQRPQGEEQRPERSVLVPPISETSEASGDVAVMPDKVRSAKEAAEYFTQPADGVRFVRHDEILPEPAVSHDEMMKMTTDITIRLANTGSVDAVPAPEDFDDAHRQMWNDLLKEINAIQKRGGIVDIPFD